MYVEGEGSRSVANYTGKYTPEQGAVYAKACKVVCDKAVRKSKVQDSRLKRLADQSLIVKGAAGPSRPIPVKHGTKQFLLHADDRCIDLCDQEHRSSPLQLSEPRLRPAASAERGSLRPVDQFHKVTDHPGESAFDNKDIYLS